MYGARLIGPSHKSRSKHGQRNSESASPATTEGRRQPIFDRRRSSSWSDPRIEWEFLPQLEAELIARDRGEVRRAGRDAGQGDARRPCRVRTGG